MKKGWLILSVLLLVGCSANDLKDKYPEKEVPVDKQEQSKETIKADENKDYLYISSSDTITLNEEQKKTLKEKQDVIETLVVNLKSEDAKKVNEALSDLAKKYKDSIQEDEQGIQRFTSFTGKAIESSNYITILTTTHPFIWQADAQSETFAAYIFSKEDGSLVSQQDMLKARQLDDETVLEKIHTYFKDHTLTICEDMPGDCYNQPEIYRGSENFPDTVMYVNENDQLVVYVQKSSGRSYEWVPIMLS